jgi:hypothetical protein
MSKEAHLPVDMSMPSPSSWTRTHLVDAQSAWDVSQNAPLSVLLAMLTTETPNVSLVPMLKATDEPAVGAFVADTLGESDWQIDSLRRGRHSLGRR